MPRGALIGNHVAKMIIEHINDLIVRDGMIMTPSYMTISSVNYSVDTFRRSYQRHLSLQSDTASRVAGVGIPY